eukprot:CAMPEP_0113882538 /NCGR_PEP_ID=MMETSP0780_2-20120614/9020_1 /TAXON_ID=652834 /ORGANISM="Palpitomonas bilix" /LENGTH=97 /DNA_ID=CAMNT_0000869583 /DNA_START=116 /DNA_END=409 /DNA_ORIENTATION=- /assembly_acc=CAM_ASM_000599
MNPSDIRFKEDSFQWKLAPLPSNPDKSTSVGKEYAIEKEYREQWKTLGEFRVVSQQLSECYRREGVNHYKNCKELAQRYIELAKIAEFAPKPAAANE